MLLYSIQEFSSYLKSSILESVRGIVFEVAEKVIRESIENNVYSNYVSEDVYVRTYQLLEIVDLSPIKVGNSNISFEIYMNTDMIYASSSEIGFNQYESVFNEDVRENVANWVEEGHGGIVRVDGRHYMKSATEILERGALIRAFATGLRLRGFTVKMG